MSSDDSRWKCSRRVSIREGSELRISRSHRLVFEFSRLKRDRWRGLILLVRKWKKKKLNLLRWRTREWWKMRGTTGLDLFLRILVLNMMYQPQLQPKLVLLQTSRLVCQCLETLKKLRRQCAKLTSQLFTQLIWVNKSLNRSNINDKTVLKEEVHSFHTTPLTNSTNKN